MMSDDAVESTCTAASALARRLVSEHNLAHSSAKLLPSPLTIEHAKMRLLLSLSSGVETILIFCDLSCLAMSAIQIII